jgi:hypothetical protein
MFGLAWPSIGDRFGQSQSITRRIHPNGDGAMINIRHNPRLNPKNAHFAGMDLNRRSHHKFHIRRNLLSRGSCEWKSGMTPIVKSSKNRIQSK